MRKERAMPEPATALLPLYMRLATLKLLPRTGWLQRGIAQPESVAEHTFGVATLALLIGEHYPALDRGQMLALYRTMCRIRAFEDAAEEASRGGVAYLGLAGEVLRRQRERQTKEKAA
jgi:hypothetical protein